MPATEAGQVPALSLADLHGSLSDPLLDAMNFLNEVVSRFPEAISFAPGRPTEQGFEPDDIPRLLAAYTRHLERDRGWTHEQVRTQLFQYGRTNGIIHELIATTVEHDEGIRVPAGAVVVTAGCQEAMLLVLRALFAEARDTLLVSSPAYVGVTGAARLLDIPVHPVPEGGDGPEAAALAAAAGEVRAAGGRPRALYLVPDFANPSGASVPVAERHRLLATAAEQDLLLIEDNPYGFFSRTGTRRPTLKALDRRRQVIHLGSFAKTALPGARVGYVLADQEVSAPDGGRGLLAEQLSKIKSMTTVNTSPISQAVIGGLLVTSDCRLREANAGRIAFYAANMNALLDALDAEFPPDERRRLGLSWNLPDGGFFVVVRLPFTADAAALEHSARAFGVVWTPMGDFYLDGGGTHHLRLSCSALDPSLIRTGVGRLASFIRQRADGAGAVGDERPRAVLHG